jgi:hypothetical protein|tara:strand:+ start:1007 stop:1819 length:813 start_codon:yes stop_codon:yes gene_type:complete
MIITHKLARQDCLSHQIFPAIEKGWKDTPMKPIHFFWGLGENNIQEIKQVTEKNEEWWYVDVGYLTEQITRYPSPIINDIDKTYFRIVKGQIHTTKGHVGTGQRLHELRHKGINVNFKGFLTGETKHILIAPSSPTVTYHTNGISQDEWIRLVTEELKKYTNREIRVRNKPRPGNQWWNTDIKDDLKDCHCLVTNMSLSAIDSIMNMVPVICTGKNVASPISSHNPKFIEKPFRPGRKTVEEWLKYVAENQFTIPEIENGTAYETLKVQL